MGVTGAASGVPAARSAAAHPPAVLVTLALAMRDAARRHAAHLQPLTCAELRIPRVLGIKVRGAVLQRHHVYHSLRDWRMEVGIANLGRKRHVASLYS